MVLVLEEAQYPAQMWDTERGLVQESSTLSHLCWALQFPKGSCGGCCSLRSAVTPILVGKHGNSVRPRDLLRLTQSISEERAGASWGLFRALLFILTCSLGLPGLWVSSPWDPPPPPHHFPLRTQFSCSFFPPPIPRKLFPLQKNL